MSKLNILLLFPDQLRIDTINVAGAEHLNIKQWLERGAPEELIKSYIK